MMQISICELSTEEAEIFVETKDQLVSQVGEDAVDDFRIVRFLKAKRFQIARTIEAIKENVEWRKQDSIDHILENYTPPKVLEMYFPMYILGTDREGSPIIVFELGFADLNGLMKSIPTDAILRYITYILALGEKYMNENSDDIKKQKWWIIIDCRGFSCLYATNKTFREFVSNVATLYRKHYPERLKAAYIINATLTIHGLVKFFRPFVPETVAAKVSVFETSEWQDKLVEEIGSAALPAYLGGTVADVTTLKTLSSISRGGKIPKKFFITTKRSDSKSNHLLHEPDVIAYVLRHREIYRVPVLVTNENCILEWEFETIEHSIGFGLNYSKDDLTPPTILIPIQRIYVDNRKESGEYFCEVVGTYTLLFDNSFSWFKSKDLYYKYTLTEREMAIVDE